MRALVTLTTDFGSRDSYVAQLKGVLYAQGPSDLCVVDLSHEIGPQEVREAALFVHAAWPRFPVGTIHLVVVDPGVGSTRRALALSCAGQLWLAPDNGVLSLLLDGSERAVAIDPLQLSAAAISATFHGRDVFAPAAARLAHGAALATLGEPADNLVRLAWPRATRHDWTLAGEVVHVDRYGNLITNIARAQLEQLAGGLPLAGLTVWLGERPAGSWPLVRCYADADSGTRLALIGSSERLELAVRDGSAQAISGAVMGALVRIELPR